MKISVVMATYNGEKYLEQQIRSILEQTLRPAELIVCDDGSTDGTVAILEKYSQAGKLSYVVNPSRLGFVRNFKKAVSLAAADNYVALSDQDDEWLPDKLKISAEFLSKFDDPALPCMVFSDLVFIDENGNVLNPSFRNEMALDRYQHTLETLLYSNIVAGCTMLMNPALRRRFPAIPDDVRYHDEWIAMVAFGLGKAQSINIQLVNYRRHNNNISLDAAKKPRSGFRSTGKQILELLRGRDSFLSEQFEIVRRFYNEYATEMPVEAKLCFEEFLALEHRSYIVKKLAYRRVSKRLRV